MKRYSLGIDIAKKTFDVALVGGKQTYTGHFTNDAQGFKKLGRWLDKRADNPVHACLEATGRYWEALALWLHESGHQMSVVNPKIIKKYAESVMQRNKTDGQDALTIADYCWRQEPDLWEPPSAAYLRLREMVRRLGALKEDRTREKNRLQAGVDTDEVRTSLQEHIAFLEQQIAQLEQQIDDHINQHPDLREDRDLLVSIPGIGDTTAACFLAEVPDVSRFPQAKQLAAYAGLTPGERQSGSQQKPGKLVKWGRARLRAAFYMPSLSAHRHNPIVAALKERLLQRGKEGLTVIVACMRKLLTLCYGVLKTRTPFDPNYAS